MPPSCTSRTAWAPTGPSTSPRCRLPEATGYGVPALQRFYRFHAPIYDWTRPFILFGRREAVSGLTLATGARVLDVGCGTGWNFQPLVERGAKVVGIECAPAMARLARERARRIGPSVEVEEEPYGVHESHKGSAGAILFSYSLSMIPPYREVLARAREDLARDAEIAVVDFLEGTLPGVGSWLGANHVFLGPERLDCLRELFPVHRLEVRSALLWKYFLFWGRAGGAGP